MNTRNPSWYDVNAHRDYPLDDGASCLADAGDRLPSSLLVDAQIYFPNTLGQVLFLSAITVSSKLVNLIFSSAESPDGIGNLPVACVHIPRPVVIHHQYAVDAMHPGVAGWVVFGSGVNDIEYAAKFTYASQSRLTPRAFRAYRTPPIFGIGRQGVATSLTGLVQLKGGDDVQIKGENLEIDGKLRRCLVFSLVDKSNTGGETRNVLEIYRSPCLASPESGNCGYPEPIEAIGVVTPNCCGAITLVFRGCAIPQRVSEMAHVPFPEEGEEPEQEDPVETYAVGGVVLTCGLGLDQACVTKNRLPDTSGRLPNEYEDLCDYSYSFISESLSWSEDSSFSFTFDPLEFEEEEFFYSFNPETDSISVFAQYTWEDLFITDTEKWTLKSGYMLREKVPVGTEDTVWAMSTRNANSLAGINILICEAEETLTYLQKAATVFSIYAGPAGSSHNAAILAGVRETEEGLLGYAAEVDWDSYLEGGKRFRIARFLNSTWETLAAIPVPSLAIGADYRLGISVFPRGEHGAWLLAELVALTGEGGTIASLGPIAISNFSENVPNMKFGLASRRSPVRFTWFGIEDIGGN